MSTHISLIVIGNWNGPFGLQHYPIVLDELEGIGHEVMNMNLAVFAADRSDIVQQVILPNDHEPALRRYVIKDVELLADSISIAGKDIWPGMDCEGVHAFIRKYVELQIASHWYFHVYM